MRYTGLQLETFTDLLEGVVPSALMPMVNRLVLSTYVNSSGAVLSLSAVAALWSASRGMYSFVTGLNAIYEVKENRGYFRTRIICMGYTLVFLLVLILTLVLHVFGGDLLRMLELLPIPAWLLNLLDLRVFLLLILQTALFATMFMVLPNQRNRFMDSLPGALLASCGWLTFSDLYSTYVEHFSGYANIYGSVYLVALSMLWLYFCISIVFYGGALNYYLSSRKS
jgi:membrane protein